MALKKETIEKIKEVNVIKTVLNEKLKKMQAKQSGQKSKTFKISAIELNHKLK